MSNILTSINMIESTLEALKKAKAEKENSENNVSNLIANAGYKSEIITFNDMFMENFGCFTTDDGAKFAWGKHTIDPSANIVHGFIVLIAFNAIRKVVIFPNSIDFSKNNMVSVFPLEETGVSRIVFQLKYPISEPTDFYWLAVGI